MQAPVLRNHFICYMKTKVQAPFQFRQFSVAQDKCSMKVGTDGVLLGAWADISDAKYVLDIGTGSGLISLMLAQRNPDILVDAVEIDPKACHQAAENFQKSPWSDRMEVFQTSIQDFRQESQKVYDLIVSNPPFFTGGTFSSPENRQLVRHTIKLPHGDLLNAARTLLAPEGKFCLILPLMEGMRFIELASHYNLYARKITEISPKPNKQIARLLLQFERKPGIIQKNELTLQNEGHNNWTEAYKKLTGDFYLNL